MTPSLQGRAKSAPPVPLREQIILSICNGITQGRFQAGDKIPEQELADALGVSRVPIREAIRVLEERGVVVTRPKHGTFVNLLTPEDAAEALRFRADLESLALQQALERLSAPQWDALYGRWEYLLDAMQAALRDDAPTLAVQCDREWHKALVGQCGNRFLFRAWCSIAYPLGIWTLVPGFWPKTAAALSVTVPYHAELLDALRRRNPDECQHALRWHILRPHADAPPLHAAEPLPLSSQQRHPHAPFVHLDTAAASTLIEIYRDLVVYGINDG